MNRTWQGRTDDCTDAYNVPDMRTPRHREALYTDDGHARSYYASFDSHRASAVDAADLAPAG